MRGLDLEREVIHENVDHVVVSEIGQVRESAQWRESFVAEKIVDPSASPAATCENEPSKRDAPTQPIESVEQDGFEQGISCCSVSVAIRVQSPDNGQTSCC